MSASSSVEPDFGQEHVPGSPRIGFQWLGSGPAVVFLHGVGGWRGNWFHQLADFGRTHRAIAWDGRGYGLSEDSAAASISIADFADDLLRLLDHLRIDRAHIVGLSMGGFIAQEFYARYPNRVRSLALADTAISLRSVHDDAFVRRFVESRRIPLTAGKRMADLAADFAAGLVLGGRQSPVYPAAVESLAIQRTDGYLKALDAVAAFDNSLDHAGVRVPTLVLVGEQDALTPPSASRVLADLIPGAQYVALAQAGHLSNLEQPLAFNRALRDFLERSHS
ncbi:MAG: alpha/beta fold hydrolase [Lautropia sp.]